MVASCTDCSAAENNLRGPDAPQPALAYLLSDVVPTGSAALFANKEMEAQRGTGWWLRPDGNPGMPALCLLAAVPFASSGACVGIGHPWASLVLLHVAGSPKSSFQMRKRKSLPREGTCPVSCVPPGMLLGREPGLLTPRAEISHTWFI